MFKRLLTMLILVGLVLGGVYGFKSFQSAMIKKYMSSMGQMPQTVSTSIATLQKWDTKLQAVGTLRAVRGVDVSSEVSGIVEGIYFNSGDEVQAGALLVKLRADDEMAALQSLQADVDLAEITYQRDLKQLKEKSIPQATVDADAANLEKSKALVAEQKAKIDKKYIRAPFTGRLGLSQIDLGQYISPGTVIVTLQSLDPIYFDFYLPQQELANIKIGQIVTVTNDLYKNKIFIGKIWALNSKVDSTTRNMQVRAALDNPDNILLPGMYGVITIDLGQPKQYITVPQTAITYNPYGNTVYVVKAGKKTKDSKENLTVEQKFVTLGPTRGDQVAVLTGLQSGDKVVTAGQIKLQNGSPIVINNTVTPSNDKNPKPSDE
jgi:membrane fusion protein (multidrug efflux system)